MRICHYDAMTPGSAEPQLAMNASKQNLVPAAASLARSTRATHRHTSPLGFGRRQPSLCIATVQSVPAK
jgi:hypothetical protein